MKSNKTPTANDGQELDFELDSNILEDNNPLLKPTEVRYSYTTNEILNNKNPRASQRS